MTFYTCIAHRAEHQKLAYWFLLRYDMVPLNRPTVSSWWHEKRRNDFAPLCVLLVKDLDLLGAWSLLKDTLCFVIQITSENSIPKMENYSSMWKWKWTEKLVHWVKKGVVHWLFCHTRTKNRKSALLYSTAKTPARWWSYFWRSAEWKPVRLYRVTKQIYRNISCDISDNVWNKCYFV